MTEFKNLYLKGLNKTKDSSLIVCGIVRDCSSEIRRNISCIEKICSRFRKYEILIFENNSIDDTKDILEKWSIKNKNVKVFCSDFDETIYKNIPTPKEFNSSNSRRRIEKMVNYRNLYMNYIYEQKIESDYLMVVDLDVTKINIKGVITSWGFDQKWDAITSYGYSISPKLKRRYHDTYALVEYGLENIPQSEDTIDKNRYRWNFLKKNMPLFKVFSAYGGLAIYKFEAIKNMNYQLINNLSGGVEVRCEHYSIYKQMKEKGYTQTYINPNMQILYQALTPKFIINKIIGSF